MLHIHPNTILYVYNETQQEVSKQHRYGAKYQDRRKQATQYDAKIQAAEDDPTKLPPFDFKLDALLPALHKAGAGPECLKAVLTSHNRKWNAVTLYAELLRERLQRPP